MTLKCSHCGAPLTAAPDARVVTCGYCHTTTQIDSTPRPLVPQPGPAPRASHAWVGALAVTAMVGAASIAVFVAQSHSRPVPAPTPIPVEPVAQVEPASPPIAPPPVSPVDPVAPAPTPSPTPRPKAPKPPPPTGPISTKADAEKVLTPALLVCMREQNVHYLITRLGNEPRGGTVPPLELTGLSVVDYKQTPNFASTPLGRCVARAAAGVRAPAYGGNYIYFGLRNTTIPDPLADAPARLPRDAAEKALAALDDEARDCATRNPSGSRPGESVSVAVYFEGATGKVSRVEPYYIAMKSPYGRCLTAVYRKASIGTFREIEQSVTHQLRP